MNLELANKIDKEQAWRTANAHILRSTAESLRSIRVWDFWDDEDTPDNNVKWPIDGVIEMQGSAEAQTFIPLGAWAHIWPKLKELYTYDYTDPHTLQGRVRISNHLDSLMDSVADDLDKLATLVSQPPLFEAHK